MRRAKQLCASPHFLKGPVSLLDLSDFLHKLVAMGPAEGQAKDTGTMGSGAGKALGRRSSQAAGGSV